MKILNQKTELVDLSRIKPHPRNVNQGDVGAIHESLEENGFYGSLIVQSSSGHILAGTHRYIAALQAGAPELPVTWVDVDDTTAIKIMLADNRTNRLGHDDGAALAALLQEIASAPEGTAALKGTAFDGDDLDTILRDLELIAEGAEQSRKAHADNYSRKIHSPVYTPKGDQPSEGDLYDRTRTEVLTEEILEADLPVEVEVFLLHAAERHTVFQFDKIAEYYAHAEPHIQDLMERSALVIIDFDQAVELGYVKLTERMLTEAGYAQQVREAKKSEASQAEGQTSPEDPLETPPEDGDVPYFPEDADEPLG